MPVLKTRKKSLMASVMASCEKVVAKSKFSGDPLVSMPVIYVLTAHRKMDTQKRE
jgi:hypothetical protein